MLHDPQLPLQQAVYAALADLVALDQTIAVYEFAPTGAPTPYVLITQQTVTPTTGSAGCRVWRCSWLLDVVTSFPAKNQVSSLPAARITEAVLERLENQRLPLAGEFQMGPIELQTTSMLTDNPTQETVDVHRYLRLQTLVEQHS
jgi:Protein of unknown function (DUF3168)